MNTKTVTRSDCADVIQRAVDRGALIQANRTRSWLRAAFQFGLTCAETPRWRGKVPDFGLTYNPVALTQRAIKYEKPGQRTLSRDEVTTLWNHLSAGVISQDFALSLKFLLSGGQRVEEVLGSEWSEFDLENGLWTIPGKRRKTRNKIPESHIVPLNDFHYALLEKIRSHSRDGYLFPHRDGEKPHQHGSLSQAVKRLCNKTGLEPFTPRDIRRTWKTLAGSIGLNLEIRNRIQGHALQDIGSRHYDRWDYLEEKRRAMKRWTDWLETLVSVQKDNVVQLQR